MKITTSSLTITESEVILEIGMLCISESGRIGCLQGILDNEGTRQMGVMFVILHIVGSNAAHVLTLDSYVYASVPEIQSRLRLKPYYGSVTITQER